MTLCRHWTGRVMISRGDEYRQTNKQTNKQTHEQTRWKVLWESTNPSESVFVANTWQHLPHLLFCGPLVSNFPTELFCEQSLVFVNNRRFTEFFDRYFHVPLPIVTKHELGLPFPPRNLRIKFGANPSTIFLVIVVTDRHRQTNINAGENIFRRFRGGNKRHRKTPITTQRDRH